MPEITWTEAQRLARMWWEAQLRHDWDTMWKADELLTAFLRQYDGAIKAAFRDDLFVNCGASDCILERPEE